MNRFTPASPLILAVAIALCAGAYIAALGYPIYRPKVFRQPEYDRAVALVKRMSPTSDRRVIVLPPDLAGLSASRRAYITEGLVFIPAWIGRKTWRPWDKDEDDRWVEGFLYSDKPLSTNPNQAFGILNVPAFCTPWDAQHDSDVQDIDMHIGPPICPHWYQVDSFS